MTGLAADAFLAAADAQVIDHLRARHLIANARHLLVVESYTNDNQRVVTVVKRALTATEWSHRYATDLADALQELPGATVTLAPLRDRVVVAWDGPATPRKDT
jgi:hypothetical protein